MSFSESRFHTGIENVSVGVLATGEIAEKPDEDIDSGSKNHRDDAAFVVVLLAVLWRCLVVNRVVLFVGKEREERKGRASFFEQKTNGKRGQSADDK